MPASSPNEDQGCRDGGTIEYCLEYREYSEFVVLLQFQGTRIWKGSGPGSTVAFAYAGYAGCSEGLMYSK